MLMRSVHLAFRARPKGRRVAYGTPVGVASSPPSKCRVTCSHLGSCVLLSASRSSSLIGHAPRNGLTAVTGAFSCEPRRDDDRPRRLDQFVCAPADDSAAASDHPGARHHQLTSASSRACESSSTASTMTIGTAASATSVRPSVMPVKITRSWPRGTRCTSRLAR